MTDVFELQEEIARAIAGKLRGTFAAVPAPAEGASRRGTKNLEAYELFLRGRTLQLKRGRFLAEAIACFEQAIALDPQYADPLAWMSDSMRLSGTFGIRPAHEAMPRARALAERAIALDPGQSEAWGTLAAVAEQYDFDYARADELWDRAFALDPQMARGRIQRQQWALCGGAVAGADAVIAARAALEEDPLNAWMGAMYSHVLALAGRHEESLVEAEKAFALDADSFFAHWNLLRAFAYADRPAVVLARMPRLFAESGRNLWSLGLLGYAHGQAGDAARARAVHDEVVARSRHEFAGASWLAVTALAAGMDDAAMTYAERAVAERDPVITWVEKARIWERLRGHPGYPALLRSIWPGRAAGG
jgi:tetratricopeptide (TPR) repeat protein